MRKTPSQHSRRARNIGRTGLVLLTFLGSISFMVFGQDASIGARTGLTANEGRARRLSREQWFLRGRSAQGENGAEQRYRAHLQKMRMRAARAATLGSPGGRLPPQVPGSGWTPLGPAPLASDASGSGQFDYGWVSGRATAVAVDPADASGNTVYVGGAYGGVWKSENAAASALANVIWQPVTDSQATLAVGAIAIQPGNNLSNSVILVGTGEANSSADSYYGLGILRSSDAGGSWILIPTDSTGSRSFAGMAFSKIAFSSNAVNQVVAATAGASEGIIEGLANPLTANLGLYYSGDSGNSWTYAKVSDGTAATSPGSATSVVYNAVANSGTGEFVAALRYHGFYSSSDSVNWTRLPNQPGPGLNATACPPNPALSSCPIYRGELAVVPGRNEMYAWSVDGNDFDQGIWRSTDGGNTWLELADTGITLCGDQFGCGTQQGSYDLELAAVPNGSSGVTDLYAGAVNLYNARSRARRRPARALERTHS
jgi:large repetitive protein